MGCSTIRAAVLAIAALAVVNAATADTIHLKSGSTLDNVDVKKETYKEVVYRQRPIPNDITRDLSEVARVEYDRVPSGYNEGVEAMKVGSFDEAIAALKDVNDRSPLYQYALYRIAESHRSAGRSDEAIAAYDKLMSEVSDSKFYPESLAAKAATLSVQKKTAEAKKIYQQLERDTKSKGFDSSWEYEAKFRIALLEGKGRRDFENMARDFERKAPSIAAKARLQVGYVLAEEGSYPEAIRYFEGILASKDATGDARGGAWAGLAQCHIRKDQAGEADFKNATYAALRTVILYPDAREAMPRALYFAGRGFELMRTPNTPWKRRYTTLYDQVIREYGATEWADLARKRR